MAFILCVDWRPMYELSDEQLLGIDNRDCLTAHYSIDRCQVVGKLAFASTVWRRWLLVESTVWRRWLPS